MKIPALLTLLLAALLAALPTRQARAEDVSFDIFYNSLADDGDWYNTPEFGYVWHPSIADDTNWRPYTDGYWAQTDDGWTWVSYESFGWATYHYGRWTRLQDKGWAWVPGYQWGPGWVSWRTNDDYVGWAPLPPKVTRNGGGGATVSVDYNDVESVDDGYTSAVDEDYDIGPDNYCFVSTPQFGAPVLARVLLPPQRNIVVFESCRNVTNIYYRRGPERTVVYNSGPDFAFISGRVERPIQRLRLERRDDLAYLRENGRGGNPTVVRGNTLVVASPLIARRPVNFEQIKPVRVKQTIEQPRVVHGWSNAGDAQLVQRVRERVKTDAQAAPRQARADLPPQNIAPAAGAEANVRPNGPGAGPGREEADRIARREGAQQEKAVREQEKAAREKTRADRQGNPAAPTVGQPFNEGQNPAGEKKARTADERNARKFEREQAQQAEAARANNPPTPNAGQPQDEKAARKAARQAEREQQKAQPPQQGNAGQEDQATRKAARQAEREQQKGQPGQPGSLSPAAQADAERIARRAEQQQQEQAQQQQKQQQAQAAQAQREARRAERQQPQAQQPQAPQPDREARRAERQQQQQQQQAPQPDREARRAERQQQQPQAQPQQAEREARHAERQQQVQQVQQAAQQAQQGQRGGGGGGGNRHEERQQAQQQPQPQGQQQGGGDDDKKKKHDH